MARVLLFHWKEEEALPLLEQLSAWGHIAGWRGMRGKAEVKITSARQFAADVVIFDLSRMPVYSKGHAELIRKAKSTAHIPFVFVEGAPEKVAPLRRIYPEEVFTTWKNLQKVLRNIKANSKESRRAPELGAEPVRQLWQKVGLAAGQRVYCEDAPREFFSALGDVPEGVDFREDPHGAQLSLFFFADWDTLGRSMDRVFQQAAYAPVWVFYRKGALKGNEVRELLLDSGLVDYKICSVNANWAGILARHKKV